MFNPNFNTSFQSMGNDPYQQNNQMQGYGAYTDEMMYNPMDVATQGNSMNMPQSMPMEGDLQEGQIYPMESPANVGDNTDSQGYGYASGGRVKRKTRAMPGIGSIKDMAETLRSKGQRQDQVLAHISPEEAQFLGQNFGGDINPQTGLPQFGLFNNPGKWLKSVAGPAGGAILGNMLLPGIGGIIGGALGGAAGSTIRGRSDQGQAAFRGAGIGAAMPTLAGLGGSAASHMGFGGLGNTLTNYGNTNAILPAIDKMTGLGLSGNSTGPALFAGQALGGGGGGQQQALGQGISAGEGNVGYGGQGGGNKGLAASLGLNDPKTILAYASLAGQYLGKEKPKTAADLGRELKEYEKARRLNAQELKEKEDHDLEEERSRRRVRLNSYLPEERLGDIGMLKSREFSPEEAARRGYGMEWYYDNEQAPHQRHTNPNVFMKEGGGVGRYFSGNTKGQDDKIHAEVSDGEFVWPADVVSDLGDGNNEAGASELYKAMANIRKDKGRTNKLPPKAKSLAQYMR